MPREIYQYPQRKVTRGRQSRAIASCALCTSMGYEPLAKGSCISAAFCEEFQLQNHLAWMPTGRDGVGF